MSNSESESSDSDYIPIDTFVGKYGPEDFQWNINLNIL